MIHITHSIAIFQSFCSLSELWGISFPTHTPFRLNIEQISIREGENNQVTLNGEKNLTLIRKTQRHTSLTHFTTLFNRECKSLV